MFYLDNGRKVIDIIDKLLPNLKLRILFIKNLRY